MKWEYLGNGFWELEEDGKLILKACACGGLTSLLVFDSVASLRIHYRRKAG